MSQLSLFDVPTMGFPIVPPPSAGIPIDPEAIAPNPPAIGQWGYIRSAKPPLEHLNGERGQIIEVSGAIAKVRVDDREYYLSVQAIAEEGKDGNFNDSGKSLRPGDRCNVLETAQGMKGHTVTLLRKEQVLSREAWVVSWHSSHAATDFEIPILEKHLKLCRSS